MKTLITLLILVVASTATASVRYERVDENRVRKIVTTETEINLEKLQSEIDELETLIEDMPETTMIEIPTGRGELEREKNEKQENLAIYNNLIIERQ